MVDRRLSVVNSKAALAAGYSPNNLNATKVQAHTLLQKPRLRQAVVDEALKSCSLNVPKALRTLVDLATKTDNGSVTVPGKRT